MEKLTIVLDEVTANWARGYAAKHDMSLSRLVAEMLAMKMREVSDYDRAMRTFLAKRPVELRNSRKRYPSRDELQRSPYQLTR